jgi:hypothetical protein
MRLAKPSETRLRSSRSKTDELVRVAERFRCGDFRGALLDAMRLLDDAPPPILCASPTYLARAELTGPERLLVTLIDGVTPIEALLDESGLGLVEGLDALGGLIDAEIATLDPDEVREPLTLPGV